MKQYSTNSGLKGFITLAITVSLASPCLADTPINSTQDSRIISGGTYYNTADHATTFINSGSGGLWLKGGATVRGQEVDTSGILTNNGGTVHLYAPGQVVRIDGTINVNGAMSAQGAALGNGGRVFIDSGYLFQNGNIFANGLNGGLVQANVGSMTLGDGAQIQAKGLGGAGGVVAINSNGPVDLRRNSIIDTSGRVVGSFDTNLISIEGSLVNVDGTVRANGIDPQFGGSRGGTIRLVSTGQSDLQDMKNTLQTGTQNPPGDSSAPTLSAQERLFILQRANAQIQSHDGDVSLNSSTGATPGYIAQVNANATSGQADPNNDYSQNSTSRSGDGGTIIVTAMHNLDNQGQVFANGAKGSPASTAGGNGGTISMTAMGQINNDHGRLEANGGGGSSSPATGGDGGNGGLIAFGDGGNGGLIAFGYHDSMTNTGGMYADGGIGGSAMTPGHGGNGGLVAFSGNTNPTGHGSIDVIARPGGNNNLLLGGKSGTIVSPNPVTLGQSQVYFQQGYENGQLVSHRATEQTQVNELLTHNENLILLTKNGNSSAPVAENLFQRMLQANIRSVEDSTGTLGQARAEVIDKNTGSSPYVYRNLVLASSRDNFTLDINHPSHSAGGGADFELTLPSALSRGQAFTTLNTLNIVNNGSVQTQVFVGPYSDSGSVPVDMWLVGRNSNSLGGGRISLLANGDVANTNVLGTVGQASGGSVDIATTGSFFNSQYLAAYLSTSSPIHGGSILVKAGQDIIHNLVNSFDGGSLTANGGLMGGTIRLTPLRDFAYLRSDHTSSIMANGNLQGGIIQINAGRNSLIEDNFDPPTFRLSQVTANGLSATEGRGGFIQVHAGNSNQHAGHIEAVGGLQDGTVSFTTGN